MVIADSKILIIGAGNIGVAIANLIPGTGYEISIADGNAESLKNPAIPDTVNKIHFDVHNETELKEALDDKVYVINAGPYFLACTIAKAAIATETHYFDLTEDIQQTDCIRKLDTGKLKTVLVPQCGLAPGFISIVANHLAQKFDDVRDVKMRVGALPMYPTNELKYNTTWSVDGLVNEYLHECHAIKDGQYIATEALEGYETFNLDGDDYEAFNTSGGLGTLCETWSGKVQSMDYKTVRYPGHNYLMKFLIHDMKLGEKELKSMINSAIPATNQDIVLIFVEVTGTKNGRLMAESWTKKIYGNGHWSAIQLTTATGICVMVEAHRQGKISDSGFVCQESLNLTEFHSIDSYRINGVYTNR